ncbi:MAG: TlpA disulfide reductase family protein [Planctomycetia bacterium]|nr:TlpA disulfide reductase family protein [Planctomycetia bacterium]
MKSFATASFLPLIVLTVVCQFYSASIADEPVARKPETTLFRETIVARHRELLRDAAKYVEQNPTASDLDEVFAWGIETSRKLGLEAEATSLAEKCLQARTTSPNLKTPANQVLCVGLAKSGRLNDAVTVFQESLQNVRFNAASDSLDLAVELVGQAGLAGEHAKAREVYATLRNRLGLNPNVTEFCENRIKKLELADTDAPEIDMTDLSGKLTTVSSFKGKILLIDFWATNCPPCLAEFPKLKQLYADYHQQGFEIVGLSLDESREIVDAFQARAQLPWQLVNEAEQVKTAREKYRVRTIPSLFLVGRDGRVANVDLKGNDLRQAVERCLKTKTP